MKHILFAAFFFPSLLVAQLSQEIPIRPQSLLIQTSVDTLRDNYQITLTITDKDAQPVEISLVIASTQFNASLGEQGLTFAGTVTVEESGGIIVAYALGWVTPMTIGNDTQYKTSSTQGSVRLKLGEDVQIIRAGTRTAKLSIKKLDAAKPK